ncbi:hypothetical protein [Peribacillus frigoritolerans]|uniref:hypothetical protein n=1 Tax=Peribacillus frigoritolerans TaxID=450367 RepID=UPI00216193ED|nr:hypothetical protein [Peribacillus frigoritolerans]
MDQQTKAKLMELFSEALDKKAHVDIHFTQYETDDFKPVFKNDVKDKAKELAEMLSVNVEERVKDSFNVGTDRIRLCFSYIPPENEYLEEDIWQEEDAV